ncbi:uncharacterized protein LOC122509950 [Leptopilina heterotoma]|uniref:uncharacterized protein LOC122509950 n=1 Tax=Leptopilina heterotoma TaxID=63436 RepID=UPI001CA7F67C|nr:uncharacterized protein LOC122509950 [Leptopilina heterotoma]XP_043480227.1 uncharacterized protein LOC122509950 [Leptopilina heterotoma]
MPEASIPVTLQSLSDSTIKQYNKPLRLWWNHCKSKGISMFEAPVPEVLSFLSSTAESIKTYGTLNSYRSAVSLVLKYDLGNNTMVKRFCKGFSVAKPSRAKYNDIWDPDNVLRYLDELGPNDQLDLKIITKKLLTLLSLSTAQRLQTLVKINIQNIKNCDNELKIYIPDKIKTSKVGKEQPMLRFPYLHEQPNLCVATLIKIYLEKTKTIRETGVDSLLFTFKKPHHPATAQTASRWLKEVMSKSGIDVTAFAGYSSKHAAVSAAKRKGLDIESIRLAAGWSKTSNVFGKFYNRPLREKCTFAKTILNYKK